MSAFVQCRICNYFSYLDDDDWQLALKCGQVMCWKGCGMDVDLELFINVIQIQDPDAIEIE